MIEKITVFSDRNVIREVIRRKVRFDAKDNYPYIIYKGNLHFLMTGIPEIGFEGKCIYSYAP